MKKTALVLALGLVIVSCTKKETTTTTQTTNDTLVQQDTLTTKSDGHNAQNALDWAGTYEATLPCADCPGIKTTVSLNQNGTFTYVSEYLDSDTKIENTGEIMWHDNGSVVHLKGKDIDTKLKVVENGLVGLDTNGDEMTGPLKDHYNYKKTM